VVAWSLALVLHAIAMIGVQAGRAWSPAPPREATPEPIHLTFVERPAAKSEPKGPTAFTELPADRKDQAPEHPEFLSNVTSRARDRVPGGDESLPRMSGETDAPSVAMKSGKAEPKPASPSADQAIQQPKGTDGKVSPAAPNNAGTGTSGASTPATPRVAAPSVGNPYETTAPGNSDTRQGEMDNPQGNASLTGDVSLSTMEWEWAPWVQRFSRKLMRAWFAPPAYYLGVLKEGGWTVVELEIARSGEVLRMDVLEEQGHESLIRSATGALRSIAPMEPLPSDFPDKTLILRVRMVYPKIRPR
jgi:hypothetical protein